MKSKISPMVFVSIIVVAMLIVGVFAWRVLLSPSSVPASAAEQKNAVSPRAGGGPDAEALKYREEYNKTHPGTAGSR